MGVAASKGTTLSAHVADLQGTFDRLEARLVAAEKEQDALRRQRAALQAKLSSQSSTLVEQKQSLQKQLSDLNVTSTTQRQTLEQQVADITAKLQTAVSTTASIKSNVNKYRTQFFSSPAPNAAANAHPATANNAK